MLRQIKDKCPFDLDLRVFCGFFYYLFTASYAVNSTVKRLTTTHKKTLNYE